MFHWFTIGIPDIWKPFCIADMVFLLLFAWAWVALGSAAVVMHGLHRTPR